MRRVDLRQDRRVGQVAHQPEPGRRQQRQRGTAHTQADGPADPLRLQPAEWRLVRRQDLQCRGRQDLQRRDHPLRQRPAQPARLRVQALLPHPDLDPRALTRVSEFSVSVRVQGLPRCPPSDIRSPPAAR